MAEAIFNQSGSKLRIQDGGVHESATMLEKRPVNNDARLILRGKLNGATTLWSPN